MSVPAPVRSADYSRTIQRRARPANSPLSPDWLLQRHLARDVRRALGAHARGLLLDVGCGGRPYEAYVPAGVRYVGVDAPGGSGAQPHAWTHADALPVASASVDAVLCTQVLEHVSEPSKVIAEAARVLRPGGKLVLTAPQSWFLHEEPFDFYRYTRFGLEHLCRGAGLEVVEWRAEGGFWALLGISLAAHVGSYARWAAERAPRRKGAGAERASMRVEPGGVPLWRRVLWPLSFPMALVNVVFAVLDTIPHPGIFAVNHLVVAVKPGAESR